MVSKTLEFHLNQLRYWLGAGNLQRALVSLDRALVEAGNAKLRFMIGGLHSQRAGICVRLANSVEAIRDYEMAAISYSAAGQEYAALEAIERAWSISQATNSGNAFELRKRVYQIRGRWKIAQARALFADTKWRLFVRPSSAWRLGALLSSGWLWCGAFMWLIAYGRSLGRLFWIWIAVVGAFTGLILHYQRNCVSNVVSNAPFCGRQGCLGFLDALYVSLVNFFGFGFLDSEMVCRLPKRLIVSEFLIGVPFTVIVTAVIFDRIANE